MEKETREKDPRITEVAFCSYFEESTKCQLINTKGLDLEFKGNSATALVSAVARSGADVKTGTAFFSGNSLSALQEAGVAEQAVADAVGSLGAESIASGEYPVLLRGNVMAVLLEGFSGNFQGDKVQKNLSRLKEKLGEKIGVDKLSILEDPFLENGARSRPFDDEGIPTRRKHLVKDGILLTYLHNQKSGSKEGCGSNGNGIRMSHKEGISVAPTNLFIEKGSATLEEMFSSVDQGMMIIDVQGTHAGINAISGDFSLQSSGYRIEGGKLGSALHKITIAGNFYSLLKDIRAIGNDLTFGFPNRSYIGAPSLVVDHITVAGE